MENTLYQLRDYQEQAIQDTFKWFETNPDGIPLIVLPTGAGKSVVIAELINRLWTLYPTDYPRTLVIVPSKELAEQNADKLVSILPSHISVGFYSASVGRKEADKEVIVGTIGSVAKNAHLLGNIKCVIIDEAHLISNQGTGQYHTFLADLNRYCRFMVLGMTATPFRGNGVWLTAGKKPLFTSIAHNTNIRTLLDQGHLSPLIRPIDAITQIDTNDIKINNGDYAIDELSDRVTSSLDAVVLDTLRLANDRKKWIAFTPTIETAQTLADKFTAKGIKSQVVTGELNKKDRETRINDFRDGHTRCLVTVLALATGFDVPSVDCIIWCRPTRSPVLYVQGAGRGLRTAKGKTDCLWLDFSDTTERLGPIDTIKGHIPKSSNTAGAPFAVCNKCGEQVRPASTLICPKCGEELRTEKPDEVRSASNARVLSSPNANDNIIHYDITNVQYFLHQKPNSLPSLRVEYFSGFLRVAKEWICFEHTGFARQKAALWWTKRSTLPIPSTVSDALQQANQLLKPTSIVVDKKAKYPEITHYGFAQHD